MESIHYDGAPYPVRSDITASHRRSWERLANAGTWWSSAERVAIAAEVRNAIGCRLCLARKEALSASAVEGQHDSTTALPEAAIDVAHRVTSDPGRLSRSWFDGIMAAGLSEGQYVESIGIVVTLVSIDDFCRALGLPLHPLPSPLPGEPSRYTPEGVTREDGWVSMIASGRTGEAEADLFAEFPGGRTGNVIRAMSLVPDAVRELHDLSASHYLPAKNVIKLRQGRAIDRMQIEFIAGRVSALNECFY
ncbi:MAG: hypothetical protein JRS35_11705 [Deltaproteobacteria bacterium]|nr:hypothetical protein [Deltaproteobacteria bacterium]